MPYRIDLANILRIYAYLVKNILRIYAYLTKNILRIYAYLVKLFRIFTAKKINGRDATMWRLYNPTAKDILTEYAVSILKDHLEVGDVVADKITNECEPFNNHPYAGDNFRFFEHEDGNFSMYWYLYFYPKKSGGYEVIVEITGAGGDAYEPIYNYEKFICQDDKITKAENIVDMKITDFYSNSDKFPKAAVEAIETAIKEHPDIGIGDNKIIQHRLTRGIGRNMIMTLCRYCPNRW